MTATASEVPLFRAPFAPPDEELASRFSRTPTGDAAAEHRVDIRARSLVEAIRAKIWRPRRHRRLFARLFAVDQRRAGAHGAGGGTVARTGRSTADRLIEDKLGAGQLARRRCSNPTRFSSRRRRGRSASPPASSTRAKRRRGFSTRIVQPPRPAGAARGDAPGDAADRLAFRIRADHRGGAAARPRATATFRYSFDMLGEGARTAADAAKLFRGLCRMRSRRSAPAPAIRRCRHGPAFRSNSRRCIRVSSRSRATRVLSRTDAARCSSSRAWPRAHDLQFTIDAEEADRLELSLEMIGAALADPSLARLGRFRARRAGLSEARAGGDRLARIAGARHQRPASRCGSSKALIGTPRSSARRSAGLPIIRCSRARR